MRASTTVVIGLDGAHFELIDRWLESDLSNVKRVIESGHYSNLQSVLPPVTSPNWKAYTTGKNPGKIGIFWWENIDTDNQRIYYPSDRKHTNTEFWELIAEQESAGIVNTPLTYPPKNIDPFLVAGAPDGENDGYTHPPSLESKLEEEFNYTVTKSYRIKDDREQATKEILNLIDLRFRVAKKLLNEHNPTFIQATTFYLNSLHHFLWEDDSTLEAWKIIDDHVGDFLDMDCNLILMSDHGSNPIRTVFHVNSWLEKEGYLTLDTATADLLYRVGINTDRLIRLATALHIQNIAEKITPQSIINRIPNEHGELSRLQKTGNINWEDTIALASGQGPLYLTLNRSDTGYEQTRDELIERLSSLTDRQNNPVADRVLRGEAVYEGSYLDEAPAIVIDQAKGVHIAGSIGRDAVFTNPEDGDWRAENKRKGLFAATGPDFGQGKVDDLSILDLAPSLLHLHGCAVPTDMDGEVRKDLFADDSPAATQGVEYQSPRNLTEEERIRRVARRANL